MLPQIDLPQGWRLTPHVSTGAFLSASLENPEDGASYGIWISEEVLHARPSYFADTVARLLGEHMLKKEKRVRGTSDRSA